MPVKSTYNHYNLTKQSKKTTVVANFAGVDLSSQRFNVSTSRAINIQNFLYKEGFIQKRDGYEQIFEVEPLEFIVKDFTTGNSVELTTNGTNFNGIWKFKAEDGLWHIVAHIGCLLYEIKNIEKIGDISITPIVNNGDENQTIAGSLGIYPRVYKYEDYKSSAFVGANRLWFLGGNKFMCLRFKSNGETKIYPVANRINSGDETEDTFIPTTTIGITYANANISVPSRSQLDYPNKLTSYRRNKLVSGIGKVESDKTQTEYYEYTLDSPLIPQSNADLENISIIIRTREEEE